MRTVSTSSSLAMAKNSHSPRALMLVICSGVMSICSLAATVTSEWLRERTSQRRAMMTTTTSVRMIMIFFFTSILQLLNFNSSILQFFNVHIQQAAEVQILSEGYRDVLLLVTHLGQHRHQHPSGIALSLFDDA